MQISEDKTIKVILGVNIDILSKASKELNEARKNQNKSIKEIANKLKIREYYLQCMEDNKWAELPSAGNGRGLTKLYARELGVAILGIENNPPVVKLDKIIDKNKQDVANLQVNNKDLSSVIDKIIDNNENLINNNKNVIDFDKQINKDYLQKDNENIPIVDANLLAMEMFSLNDGKNSFIESEINEQHAISSLEMEQNNEKSKFENKITNANQTPALFETQQIFTEMPLSNNEINLQKQSNEEKIYTETKEQYKTEKSSSWSEIPNSVISNTKTDISRKNSTKNVKYIVVGIILIACILIYFYYAKIIDNVYTVNNKQEQVINSSNYQNFKILKSDKIVPTIVITANNELAVIPVQKEVEEPIPTNTEVPINILEQKAILTILSEVEIIIKVDDKYIHNGMKEKGQTIITFVNYIDILVSDGSKISINYEGWENHGKLGWQGRKRRLILNAHKYSGHGKGIF